MDSTLAKAGPSRGKPAAKGLAGLPIGEILVAQGVVSPERVAEALAAQAERGGRLGEVLISLKACSEEQVLKALAAQLELPYQMRLAPDEVAPELIKLVPINFAKQAKLLPLRIMTDGDANCSSTLDQAIAAAKTASGGAPPVKTFVVGSPGSDGQGFSEYTRSVSGVRFRSASTSRARSEWSPMARPSSVSPRELSPSPQTTAWT